MRKLEPDEFKPKHRLQTYELAKKWWARISSIPIIYEDVERFWNMGLGTAWVDDKDNIIGYYILMKHPHPFNSGCLVATILSIVIDENYRGSPLFFKMWRDIKEECEIWDVKEISFGDTVECPTPFIKKLGFKITGTTYRREQ